jgi:hypothetical protein
VDPERFSSAGAFGGLGDGGEEEVEEEEEAEEDWADVEVRHTLTTRAITH